MKSLNILIAAYLRSKNSTWQLKLHGYNPAENCNNIF